MGAHLYLEDLSVGKKFASDSYQLDEDEIVRFASTYDPQAFHTDPIRAENTFFKGLCASGWQTAAVTMRLVVTSVFRDSGVIGMGADVIWLKPVRPGDALHAETVVKEIHPSTSNPEKAVVLWQVETRNQRDEVVQTMTTRTFVFSKTAQNRR